jgi:hypothetical protein
VTEAALRTMREYVVNKTTDNSLVIMGPPKSSKTTMLHEMLPRLVVASKPATEPVFVRIVFQLGFTPSQAWLLVKIRLAMVARAFAIEADVPSDANAEIALDDFALDVAAGLQKQGRRLWLLIDECQVIFQCLMFLCCHVINKLDFLSQAPLLNARDPDEKRRVAYFYKALVGMLSDIGCCAFTGSSMVTFLNSVRDLRPNGFEMFNCAEYVLLGHRAPSKQWSKQIATSLIESMKKKQGSNWLHVFGPNLTPALVLSTLRSKPELFTVRPALIHQVLKHLDDSKSEEEIQSRLDAFN